VSATGPLLTMALVLMEPPVEDWADPVAPCGMGMVALEVCGIAPAAVEPAGIEPAGMSPGAMVLGVRAPRCGDSSPVGAALVGAVAEVSVVAPVVAPVAGMAPSPAAPVEPVVEPVAPAVSEAVAPDDDPVDGWVVC
jgi:hypothetical protein